MDTTHYGEMITINANLLNRSVIIGILLSIRAVLISCIIGRIFVFFSDTYAAVNSFDGPGKII